MLALLLMAISHLLGAVSSSIGKGAMNKKTETTYSFIFLNLFYFSIFLILGVLFFGAAFKFETRSLPFFIPRMILEILVAQLSAIALAKADLSTFSFLRLISIPLLLAIDVMLGYTLRPVQILGILIIFGSFIFLFSKKTLARKGSGYVITMALIIPLSLSLFKYDITHYNSVAGEQIVMSLVLMTYFTAAAWLHKKERTWAYLTRPLAEKQALTSGFSAVLNSYAYTLVPASIGLTFSRSAEIFWAIIFGHTVFHEHKLGRKLIALIVVAASLFMISYHR